MFDAILRVLKVCGGLGLLGVWKEGEFGLFFFSPCCVQYRVIRVIRVFSRGLLGLLECSVYGFQSEGLGDWWNKSLR